MTASSRTIAFLAILGFVGFLLWTTLAAQRVECTVEVEYLGKSGTGSASAATEAEAEEQAMIAACGPLTGSMNDRIACGRTRPVVRQCRPV